MIKISQLKVPSTDGDSSLITYIAKYLGVLEVDIKSHSILKRSIDARKKPDIFYVYTVCVSLGKLEGTVLKKNRKNKNISVYHKPVFELPSWGDVPIKKRPLIIGAGPAGLFCAYLLGKAGFAPIVLERGSVVEKRQEDVLNFWKTGRLNLNSNVQFGEGGAGTFSDGKLNTLVKDKTGKNQFVLETFVTFGAPEQILWDAKPHIGTDILISVIKRMREEMKQMGVQFLFDTQVTDFEIHQGALRGVHTKDAFYDANVCILAIGHSARDTFLQLFKRQVHMSAKEFAVGFRVEHPQEMINKSQYGDSDISHLPVAPYKLATKLKNDRGVYSFCMCPGGYVVNASSLEQQLVVNGMSYSKRDSNNANSAIVVSVGSKEYDVNDPLGAIAFQNQLEQKAYKLCDGKIPQQLFGDFVSKKASTSYGDFLSEAKGECALTDLNPLFSESIRESFLEGMELFGHYIQGFDRKDTILSGVESRTSSPVRIHRDEQFESNIKGLYPCGEGAGYAGGIMSAAMDGLRIAEEIIKKYKVDYER